MLAFEAPKDTLWSLRKQRPTAFGDNKNRPKRKKMWPKEEPVGELNKALEWIEKQKEQRDPTPTP